MNRDLVGKGVYDYAKMESLLHISSSMLARIALLEDDELGPSPGRTPKRTTHWSSAPASGQRSSNQEERNRRLYDLLLTKPELAAMIEQQLNA